MIHCWDDKGERLICFKPPWSCTTSTTWIIPASPQPIQINNKANRVEKILTHDCSCVTEMPPSSAAR